MVSPSVPAVSVVGFSNSGKTTFLEKLILVLKGRGLRLGVIKHDVHGFDIDVTGTDSWRFSHAGADVVAIASPQKAAFIEQRSLSLDGLLSRVTGVDLILTEGFKSEHLPKIEVHRVANGKPLCAPPEELLALVADLPESPYPSVPLFGLDSAEAVADLLLKRYGLSSSAKE